MFDFQKLDVYAKAKKPCTGCEFPTLVSDRSGYLIAKHRDLRIFLSLTQKIPKMTSVDEKPT